MAVTAGAFAAVACMTSGCGLHSCVTDRTSVLDGLARGSVWC